MDNPPPNLSTITDRGTHDAALKKGQGTSPSYTDSVPTLIYVCSSSIPACKTTTPKVVALARANPHVAVYVMELTAQVSPMIKFGPQNTPIFIALRGKWCETVLGPDFGRVERLVEARLKGE